MCVPYTNLKCLTDLYKNSYLYILEADKNYWLFKKKIPDHFLPLFQSPVIFYADYYFF